MTAGRSPWAGLTLVGGVAVLAYSALPTPSRPTATPTEKPWALVVSGDTDGYLSPCGCTSPMTGGILRRATAIERLRAANRVVLVDNGGFGGAPDALFPRQSELKAETMAQTFARLDAAAVHLTARDAQLGRGTLDQVSRLSGGCLVSSNLSPGVVDGLKPFVHRGPFEIGGFSSGIGQAMGVGSDGVQETVTALLEASRSDGAMAVLLYDGTHDDAKAVARRYPDLAAVVYRYPGWPPDSPEKIGHVWLLTPGERGKSIVRATVANGAFTGYGVTRLGPDFADDAKVSALYRTYLGRVDAANLLDQFPRAPSAPFAGSAACAKCHSSAYQVWRASGHSHALATLEAKGHGRDPDCVSCHIVGLDAEGGFRSRSASPQLAFVGCESCHGPGSAHAAAPRANPLPKVGEKPCLKCHTPDQSPGFRFLTFWPKVAHR